MRGVVVIVVLISYLSFIHCCFSYCTRNTSIAQFKYARKYLADANGKSLGTPIRSRKYSNDVIIPFTSFLLLFTALRNNDSYSDPGIVFGLSPSDMIVNPMILNTSSTKPINSFVSDSAYGSANSAPNVLRIFLDPFGPPLDANLLIPGPSSDGVSRLSKITQYKSDIEGGSGAGSSNAWKLPLEDDDTLQPLYNGIPLPKPVLQSVNIECDNDGSYKTSGSKQEMKLACQLMAVWKLCGTFSSIVLCVCVFFVSCLCTYRVRVKISNFFFVPSFLPSFF